MLKKSSFVIFTCYFILIFVLYQFIVFNTALSNEVILQNEYLQTNNIKLEPVKTSSLQSRSVEYAVINGGETSKSSTAVTGNVTRMLSYMGKTTVLVSSFSELPEESENLQTLIITTKDLDKAGNYEDIQKFIEDGGNLIIAAMPDFTLPGFNRWSEFLGIVEYQGLKTYKKFHITEDILLGGNLELEKDVSSYPVLLNGKCKTFAFGIEFEEKNPIIWRRYHNDGCVAVLNADWMEDAYSMGIFTGMLELVQPDFVYPVVNAGTYHLNGYPVLQPINTQQIQQTYNRTSKQLMEEVIWPNLVSIICENDISYNFIYAYCFNEPNQEEPIYNYLKFFTNEALKLGGELCIGGYISDSRSNITAIPDFIFANGLGLSKNTANDYLPNYHINAYMPNDKYIAEYLDKWKEILPEAYAKIGFYKGLPDDFITDFEDNGSTVSIPIATEGMDLTDEMLWRLQNFTTASGMISHYIDIRDIIINVSTQNIWEDRAKELAITIDSCNKKYPWIEKATASETANKIRKYLQSTPVIKKSGDKLIIEDISQGEEMIVNTHETIIGYENCTVTKIDNNRYLLKSNGNNAALKIKEG